MATLTTIAREAGVSVRTASVALNGDPKAGRIAPERVLHIRQIAENLGYRPHAGARAMKGQRFRQVGLVFRVDAKSQLAHALIMEMLLGVNAALQPQDYVVSLVSTIDTSGPSDLSSRALKERALDNLIVVDSVSDSLRGWIDETFPRAIWANADVWRDQNCVRRDEIDAGRVAAEQMFALGYRKLLYIERAQSPDYVFAPHYSFTDRRRGVTEAAAAAAVDIRFAPLPLAPDRGAERENALAPYLSPDTAVIVGDVYLARALQQSFSNLNKRPGIDFAVCCCDDADELGEVWTDLARVTFERFKLGRLAGEMTLRSLLEPGSPRSSIVLKGEWKSGRTARPMHALR